MPYDLTYKRNIINKTNEQNRTRDLEIKNKVILTRGEGEGGNGGRRGRDKPRNTNRGLMDTENGGIGCGSGGGLGKGDQWRKRQGNCN